MTHLGLVDRSPYAMSGRAQIYISAAGGRHLGIGLFLLLTPWLFSAAAYVPLFNTLPLAWWGFIMTTEGILCFAATWWRNADVARLAMVISATMTLVLGAGVSIGIVGAWVEWVGRVGWDVVLNLIWTRPPIYPADLLGLGVAPPSPLIPLVLLPLTIKDYAMCAQPLRVPFEDVRARVV